MARWHNGRVRILVVQDEAAIAVLRKKLEADPARPQVILSIKGAGDAWRLPW
jgi:DNA-binding response OmpR family regulator